MLAPALKYTFALAIIVAACGFLKGPLVFDGAADNEPLCAYKGRGEGGGLKLPACKG